MLPEAPERAQIVVCLRCSRKKKRRMEWWVEESSDIAGFVELLVFCRGQLGTLWGLFTLVYGLSCFDHDSDGERPKTHHVLLLPGIEGHCESQTAELSSQASKSDVNSAFGWSIYQPWDPGSIFCATQVICKGWNWAELLTDRLVDFQDSLMYEAHEIINLTYFDLRMQTAYQQPQQLMTMKHTLWFSKLEGAKKSVYPLWSNEVAPQKSLQQLIM